MGEAAIVETLAAVCSARVNSFINSARASPEPLPTIAFELAKMVEAWDAFSRATARSAAS